MSVVSRSRQYTRSSSMKALSAGKDSSCKPYAQPYSYLIAIDAEGRHMTRTHGYATLMFICE